MAGMQARQRLLKYAFTGLSVIAAAFIALHLNGLSSWIFPICCIVCILLASPFFYPAFYGNKRDYLRLTGFSLLAAVITAGLMAASDWINPSSGMIGLLLEIEILLFAPVPVLVTTAFCCRMGNRLKTAVPGMVFFVYAALATYLASTVKDNEWEYYFLLFEIVVIPLLLPLTVIMTVRILFFKQHETADDGRLSG